ncbi:MAG: Uma2 family endonuclease, partial [Dehalococcoidia bacterium]
YVSGNMLLYYEEGNPRASVAPDVFVVMGVPKLPKRRIYKLWEEGAPPLLVIEVTSPSTRREDRTKKHDLYARLGVREYVLYDPLGEYLRPPLQGYRLREGAYIPMDIVHSALLSEAFPIRFALDGSRLLLIDANTGTAMPTPSERLAADLEATRALVSALQQQAAAAKARITELERRLDRGTP